MGFVLLNFFQSSSPMTVFCKTKIQILLFYYATFIRDLGWNVLVIWECELNKTTRSETLNALMAGLLKQTPKSQL